MDVLANLKARISELLVLSLGGGRAHESPARFRLFVVKHFGFVIFSPFVFSVIKCKTGIGNCHDSHATLGMHNIQNKIICVAG